MHCYHTQVEDLRREIARLEETSRPKDDGAVPSGCAALDRILPERGFCRGTLVEWLSTGDGAGAATLALLTAREACRQGGTLVVLDRGREFYPPAAARWGIDLARLIVVHVANRADHHWALDQSLRCPAVAAVLAWPDAVDGKFDGRTFRRLQLAAETGGSLGLLVRPETARHQPSWADVRLWVEPQSGNSEQMSGPIFSPQRRLRLVLLRCRGGTDGRIVDVEIDDETNSVCVVAGLAPTAAQCRVGT